MEDEANIRSFVGINLKRAGYEAIEASTGPEALEKIASNPDIGVAILDIMVPEIDGFEVCRRIRTTNKKMGIIMLTARTQEMDKVTGLMTGADDYVTKPFSPAELTARVDALFRRTGGEELVMLSTLHKEVIPSDYLTLRYGVTNLHLPGSWAPRHIIPLKYIPTLPNGKLDYQTCYLGACRALKIKPV